MGCVRSFSFKFLLYRLFYFVLRIHRFSESYTLNHCLQYNQRSISYFIRRFIVTGKLVNSKESRCLPMTVFESVPSYNVASLTIANKSMHESWLRMAPKDGNIFQVLVLTKGFAVRYVTYTRFSWATFSWKNSFISDCYVKFLLSKCMSMIIISHSLRVSRKIADVKAYNSMNANFPKYLTSVRSKH